MLAIDISSQLITKAVPRRATRNPRHLTAFANQLYATCARLTRPFAPQARAGGAAA
jgi:hypothetical protein